MTETFFEGDTVELFSETEYEHLDSATTIEFIVRKPSGASATWTATQVDPTKYTDPEYADLDLTNTCIVYTTDTTDLDEIGTYQIESHVIWSGTSELHGEIVKFKVKAHLTEPVVP
jgi:hypothetical protein